jgi:hypothetical protein
VELHNIANVGTNLRYIEGKGLERFCTECEKWLPVREFNRRVNGYAHTTRAYHWFHLCRNCRSIKYDRTAHGDVSGLVPVSKVWWIYDEIVRRVGMYECAELCGVSYDTIRLILYRKSRHVQKRNVRNAMTALRDLRDNDVWTTRIGRKPAYRRVAEL